MTGSLTFASEMTNVLKARQTSVGTSVDLTVEHPKHHFNSRNTHNCNHTTFIKYIQLKRKRKRIPDSFKMKGQSRVTKTFSLFDVVCAAVHMAWIQCPMALATLVLLSVFNFNASMYKLNKT